MTKAYAITLYDLKKDHSLIKREELYFATKEDIEEWAETMPTGKFAYEIFEVVLKEENIEIAKKELKKLMGYNELAQNGKFHLQEDSLSFKIFALDALIQGTTGYFQTKLGEITKIQEKLIYQHLIHIGKTILSDMPEANELIETEF